MTDSSFWRVENSSPTLPQMLIAIELKCLGYVSMPGFSKFTIETINHPIPGNPQPYKPRMIAKQLKKGIYWFYFTLFSSRVRILPPHLNFWEHWTRRKDFRPLEVVFFFSVGQDFSPQISSPSLLQSLSTPNKILLIRPGQIP